MCDCIVKIKNKKTQNGRFTLGFSHSILTQNPSAMHHPEEKVVEGWRHRGTKSLGVLGKWNSKIGLNLLNNLMDGGAILGMVMFSTAPVLFSPHF